MRIFQVFYIFGKGDGHMTIKTHGTQKEAQVLDLTAGKKPNPILFYDIEYDSTKPKETIRNFVNDIQNMVSRYEGNKARIVEIENELQDIFHYLEYSSYKTVPNGYRLYRKIAELRKERRACKNENDLLQPIYEYFHATEVLNRLSTVQGECGKLKYTIDARGYTVRTSVLDEWLGEAGKEPEAEKEDEPVLKAAT